MLLAYKNEITILYSGECPWESNLWLLLTELLSMFECKDSMQKKNAACH